jgi:hypothetical protein
MWLFAQERSHEPQSIQEVPIALWIVLGAGVVLLGAVIIGFKSLLRHLRKNREMLHAERSKALELGQPANFSAPDRSKERYGHNCFWVAFWVGAALPMVAVGSVASATSQTYFSNIGIVIVMWVSVTLISVAGVVGATIVMVSARRMASESAQTAYRGSPQEQVQERP